MPIPNVTSKYCPTLNHMFTVPSSHQRNFVLENKQFVRDKSKQRQKQQQYGTDDQFPIASYTTHRGEGRNHIGLSSGRSSTRLDGGKELVRDVPSCGNYVKSHMPPRGREYQTMARSEEALAQKSSKSVPLSRRQTVTRSMKQKTTAVDTQNVAVQTDEINDEIYLYTALKKCASPAFKSALKAKYLQKGEEAKEKNQEQQLADERQLPPTEGPNLRSHQRSKQTETIKKREQYSCPSLESEKYESHFEAGDHAYQCVSDVNDQFNVMPLSHGMKKTCQPNSCTNCPAGYHLLTEKEREQIKLKLLERETLLIKQLNSFPLAIETLRVRQSKTRIEHELSILEQSLRKLTKRKVYVKLNES